MDVFKREAQLNKPVHDFGLCEKFIFGPPLLDVERKIAHIAKLHNDYQNALVNKTPFICDNIRMGKRSKQVRLIQFALSSYKLPRGELLLIP